MASVFLFDALAGADLLRIVLGRAVSEGTPARAGGFAHCRASLPVLRADEEAVAEGYLFHGLSDGDLARLRFFIEDTNTRLRDIPVAGAKGLTTVLAPVATDATKPDPARAHLWALADLRAAEEVMAWYRRRDIAQLRHGIFRRAWSWALARQNAPDPARDLGRDVRVVNLLRPHINFFGIEEADLRHRLHDGGMSPVLNRGTLMVGSAAVVLPYDPVRDAVHMIEQFRTPPLLAGFPRPWTWEPVAGLIDAGEFPEETAHREAREEAGLTLGRLEPAGKVFSSTGSSGEFLHLFIGLCDLSQPALAGGLESEGEDIRSRILPFDELMQGVDAEAYVDMPLVTCALWLARHRTRLRA